MTLPLEPSAGGNSDRWVEIMNEASSNAALLADRFVAQVETLPSYGDGTIDSDTLRTTARQSLRLIIDSLSQLRISPELISHAHTVGMTRARFGVPSASLDRAARLDFTILWAHLLELCGPPDASLLATRVELVWRIVDEYVGAITSSYEQETVRLARSERVYLRDFLSRLFSRSGKNAETVANVATALRVDAGAAFTVIAVSEEHEPALRSILAARRYNKVFEYDKDGLVYLFWPSELREAELPDISSLVCGIVNHVDGLGAIPEASTTAGSLAKIARADDGGPVSAQRGWTRLVRGLVHEADLEFVDDVDLALSVLREAERERIEETVRAFLACGSVNLTAERLFCHRNTILNRLNRFEELTRIDLVVPAQSARLVLGWL